jgi:hypothetical protein
MVAQGQQSPSDGLKMESGFGRNDDILGAAPDGRAMLDHPMPAAGAPMRFDHRRILATAIARLRAKLKYRPVVFELMAPESTLTEMQRTVEAISGRHLHQQNFRRLVEMGALVEPTGATSQQKRGRPAALFRFRREGLKERPVPGLRFGGGCRRPPSAVGHAPLIKATPASPPPLRGRVRERGRPRRW